MANKKLQQVKIHFDYESGQRYTVKGPIADFGFTENFKSYEYTLKVKRDNHKVTEIHEIPLYDVASITVQVPEHLAKAINDSYQKVVHTFKHGMHVSSTGFKSVM